MNPSPDIVAFLDIVCREIKYKKLHQPIKKELSEHFTDQIDAYLVKGISQEEAKHKAIQDMGDPIIIGQSLNKTHRPRVNWTIITLISMIILLNSCFFYFTIFNNDLYYYHDKLFINYIHYVSIGLLVFLFFYFLDYTWIYHHIGLCYICYILTMMILLISTPLITGGRYMAVYPALLFIPLFATIIYRLRSYNHKGIILALLLYLPSILVTYATNFKYPLYIVTCSCMFLILFSIKKDYIHVNENIKKNLKYINTLILAYVGYRLYSNTMMLSQADPLGRGHINQIIREIMIQVKPFGSIPIPSTTLGISSSLPEWYQGHYLLYILGKYGYIPALIFVSLVLIFIYAIYRMIRKQQQGYGFLLSVSCILIMIMQIVTTILSNIGIVYSHLCVIPFISYGSRSFIINMALLGLSLSIYRRRHLMPERKMQSNSERITYQDGKIIIDIKRHIIH